jgi:inosine-uridine nucleoside N-ribohydrolase
MVPLDATNQVLITKKELRPWNQGDEKAKMVVDLYNIMFNNYGFKSTEIFDLTAAVIMAQPDSCVFQQLHLDVITDEGSDLGQTIIVTDSEPNIHVCLEPNAKEIKLNLNETFSK